MTKYELRQIADAINNVVTQYFQKNPAITEVKPKDVMPFLVRAGVFRKDHRDGLPLRNVLRELDSKNLLHLIPLLRVERKTKNRFWYFTAAGRNS